MFNVKRNNIIVDSSKENESFFLKRFFRRFQLSRRRNLFFFLFLIFLIFLFKNFKSLENQVSSDSNNELDISLKLSSLKQKEKELDLLIQSLKNKELYLEQKGKQFQEEEPLPKQQNLQNELSKTAEKRESIKQAFLFAWKGYEQHAWGKDELRPVDGGSHNWMGLGLTIVDSLDTLLIMDLQDEFNKARTWVNDNLKFDIPNPVSFFETTIRILGGLLSAYELSGDKMFLEKADQLGSKLLPAFRTKNGLPHTTINLLTGVSTNPTWSGGSGILSEMGTVQLEFTYLAHHTNKPIYKEKALKVFDILSTIQKNNGLYSIYINIESLTFSRNHVSLGAMGDSFYEYLIKIWFLTDKTLVKYRSMYDEAIDNIKNYLIKKSDPSSLTYIAEYIGNSIDHKMDHLVCFAGAMFAIGSLDSPRSDDMEIAKEITKTCYELYNRTTTGISGELVRFQPGKDFFIPTNARYYLLRPETVESFFVLWRKTHDPIYREMGWQVFQSINKYCKTTYGYSGIRDVTSTNPQFDNVQQSFFLAETLKYLFLLFSDDSLIPLDKYVFNTEAHPLGVLKSE